MKLKIQQADKEVPTGEVLKSKKLLNPSRVDISLFACWIFNFSLPPFQAIP